MKATIEYEQLPEDAISAASAAALIRVHFSTIKRWVEKGIIGGWYKGERIFVSEAEVRRQIRRVPVKQEEESPRTTAQAEEAARAAEQRIERRGWK